MAKTNLHRYLVGCFEVNAPRTISEVRFETIRLAPKSNGRVSFSIYPSKRSYGTAFIASNRL